MLLENLPRAFSCKIRTRRGGVSGSYVGVALAAGTERMLPRPQVRRVEDDALMRCDWFRVERGFGAGALVPGSFGAGPWCGGWSVRAR